MKKIILALLFILGLSTFASQKMEINLSKTYARSILTGAPRKTAERISITMFNEVPKLTDFEYGYGLEYQFKGKKAEQLLIPNIGLRYYPVNFIDVFGETKAGVTFKPNSNTYYSNIRLGIGIGRDSLVNTWFVSLTGNHQLTTGISIGYRI